MPKATSSTAYSGQVKIKIKTRNGTKTIKKKNTGTDTLFRAIARALAGYSLGSDIPTYISLAPAQKVEYKDDENEVIYTRMNPVYDQSSSPISVTGRSYGQDSSGNWFCRVTATIPKSNFESSWNGEKYCAVLLNGNNSRVATQENTLAYLYLATVPQGVDPNDLDHLTPIDLTQMADGSSLIVEWDLYVRNYDEVNAGQRGTPSTVEQTQSSQESE